jgi:hypothetical protein
VSILREELRLLVREGVSVVRIDDPHPCLFVDPGVRARYDDSCLPGVITTHKRKRPRRV